MAKEEFLKPYRLAEILRPEIAETPPHEPIPTERQLAERFGVSRVSVRQALALLNEDGAIYTVHGSGSFVAPARVTKQMKLLSFSQEMEVRGLTPKSKVLNVQTIEGGTNRSDDWAGISEPTHRIERLRYGNDDPMSWEVTYISAEIAPDLLDQDLTGSLYTLLKNNYGQEIVSADEQLIPILIDDATSTKMKLTPGKPGLEIHRHGFNIRGQQVELSRTIRRGDRWDFRYTVRA